MPDICIEVLREQLIKCSSYLEYGSGGSTFLAMENGTPLIQSVESDREWITHIERVKNERLAHFSGRHKAHWIDIGSTGNWGYPTGTERHADYWKYPLQVWTETSLDDYPQLVLIDGRFRVACFITTILHAKPGTIILFDDYLDRPHYHVVESILKPEKMMDRMAFFFVEGPMTLKTEILPQLFAATQDTR